MKTTVQALVDGVCEKLLGEGFVMSTLPSESTLTDSAEGRRTGTSKRPRGRAPKGKIWKDGYGWVPDGKGDGKGEDEMPGALPDGDGSPDGDGVQYIHLKKPKRINIRWCDKGDEVMRQAIETAFDFYGDVYRAQRHLADKCPYIFEHLNPQTLRNWYARAKNDSNFRRWPASTLRQSKKAGGAIGGRASAMMSRSGVIKLMGKLRAIVSTGVRCGSRLLRIQAFAAIDELDLNEYVVSRALRAT